MSSRFVSSNSAGVRANVIPRMPPLLDSTRPTTARKRPTGINQTEITDAEGADDQRPRKEGMKGTLTGEETTHRHSGRTKRQASAELHG